MNMSQIVAWLKKNQYEDVTEEFIATANLNPMNTHCGRVFCLASGRSVQVSLDTKEMFVSISAEENTPCNDVEITWLSNVFGVRFNRVRVSSYAQVAE